MTDKAEYLINKRGVWYRPNAQGYTSDPAQAGRYTEEEAQSYTHPNGIDGPRDGMFYKHESEVPNAVNPLQDRVKQLEATNAKLREALQSIVIEAERENGRWQHLKRVIGNHACKALESSDD